MTQPIFGFDASNTVYDPTTNKWTELKPMDVSRARFGAAALDGKIYVVGGAYDMGTYSGAPPAAAYLATGEVYDPSSDKWTPIAECYHGLILCRRGGHSVVALGGKIYAIGGQQSPPAWPGGSHDALKKCDVYDPITDSWAPIGDMNHGRVFFGCGVCGGRIYAMGGTDGGWSVLNNTCEVYDPIDNSWNMITDISINDIATQATAVLGGKIFQIGGATAGGIIVGPSPWSWDWPSTSAVSVYDPTDNSWNYTHPPIPSPRYGGCATTTGGKIYYIWWAGHFLQSS